MATTPRLKLVLGSRPGIIGDMTANSCRATNNLSGTFSGEAIRFSPCLSRHTNSTPGQFETSFRYSDQWQESPESLELAPALLLTRTQHRRDAARHLPVPWDDQRFSAGWLDDDRHGPPCPALRHDDESVGFVAG